MKKTKTNECVIFGGGCGWSYSDERVIVFFSQRIIDAKYTKSSIQINNKKISIVV